MILDLRRQFAQCIGIGIILVQHLVALVGARGRAVDDGMLLLVRDVAGVEIDGLYANHE